VWACTPDEEIITRDTNARLRFSENAVVFDTIFTDIESITRRLTVYNPNKQAVVIDEVYLGNSADSPYEVIINGRSLDKANKIRVLGGDSLLLLVKANINSRNENLPFVIYDSLMFLTNGNLQNIKLLTWGQDAHFLRYKDSPNVCNSTWTSGKPYILLDSLQVPVGCKLTIKAGAHVYSYTNAQLIVNGSLDVQGSSTERVVFADFQKLKESAPGQWGGIVFSKTSKGNTIKGAEIRNAISGLEVHVGDEGTKVDVTVENSIIKNMLQSGINAVNSDILLSNTLITNCIHTLFNGQGGGNYVFKHCTLANFNYRISRELPAVIMGNLYRTPTNQAYPLKWDIHNSIIWGNFTSEILITNNPAAEFTINSSHNVLKTTPLNYFEGNNNLLNVRPSPLFKDERLLNFKPDTLSPLINAGVDLGITEDITGKKRDAKPDIGAYEF
jgi:hypothetical protein